MIRKIFTKASQYEILFENYLIERKITYEREYRFLSHRRYRFDFAILGPQIAIEIEGGIFTGGRHISAMGFLKDCEKYNLASIEGWRLIRIPTNWFKSDFDKIEHILDYLR